MADVKVDYIKRVDKIWGTEYWLQNCEKYCLKYLLLVPGRSSSKHFHRDKDETFYVEHGIVNMELDGEPLVLHQGHSIRIRPGQVHKFWNARGNEEAMIVEVSTTHDDNDVVRLEESHVLP